MKKQPGFVLIELLLAVLVLVIISGAVIKASSSKQAATTTVAISKKQNTPSPSPRPSGTTAPKTTASPVATTPTPAKIQPVTAASPIQTVAPQNVRPTETYRILADGQTAQESPVTMTLSATGDVDLAINLICAAACQFKLASDTYPISNNTIYTSSQTIIYTLSHHGTWYFYNQYTPNTKFGIKF